MENLGAYLNKLREAKGKTCKMVYEDLFLREEQIRQIEDNRFFELGPYGHAKAIVYKYAIYLEADVDAVMAELRVMLPEHTKKEFKPKKTVKEKKILLSPNFFWVIGIIAFVIVLSVILWHAYRQGWLKTPDLFKASSADTTAVVPQKTEKPKPDTLRNKMRQLSESVGKETASKPSGEKTGSHAVQDSTDYLGEILGASQVNVPLH